MIPDECPECEYDKIAAIVNDRTGDVRWSCPNCGESNHD